MLNAKRIHHKRKNKTLKKKLAGVENEVRLRQCWEKRQLQSEHAERLSKEKEAGKTKVKELQDLALEMRIMMQCNAVDIDIKDREVQHLQRKVRRLTKQGASAKDRAASNKIKMKEWQAKHNQLLDQLAGEQESNGELNDDVLQWKETVANLEEQLVSCHDTIHDMTPITIKKV